MEAAVIGVVAVLFVVTVAITCILCCFSYASETQDPQRGLGHSFTVATFHQETSFFTRPGRQVPSSRNVLTIM
ncbi:small regulatory polypeptide of amino acid response [Castor canadensis]|jgi:hypothetical protein|uniref:Small regulatory polypeptide of amino acid response n=2 Tax=Castor canadensis TaxID=51338 RepID=A0A8C0ZYT6_CASCN